MIRKIAFGLMLLASVAVVARPAAAQGFGPHYMDVGPTIGFGSVGSASVAFGARFETFAAPLPSLANGMLGIQIGATYYHWSNANYKVAYIPIGVTANYHFRLADSKLDPFLGLGLGYEIVTCSYPGSVNVGCGSSALYFIGRAGVRYFIAPKLALYADVGAGGAAVNLGVMFKLK